MRTTIHFEGLVTNLIINSSSLRKKNVILNSDEDFVFAHVL
jgi:hypothetical protein